MEIIEYIAIEKILLPENRMREKIPHNGIRELGQSIMAVGMLNPLVLRPGKEGTFVLVCGNRRLRAAKEVGLTRVPAIVIPMDDKRAEEFALVENTLREPLTDGDLVRAYSRRQGRDDKVAFCRALGWHISKISDICAKIQVREENTECGRHVQIKGATDIRLVDNTVQRAVDLIQKSSLGATMLREEDEQQVSYTIRVKKPV